MSKYELTISTGYVPSWTYVEAIRELFQNAIDNEKINPENKMLFEYSNETLKVCNKSSKLTLDSLLIGNSTKRGDDRTIGEHGEGYKIAFMVLLREGKEVTVYNYGANEIWTTKLVKSRRFNGAQVVQIDVNKTPFWSKVPNYNLTIEVNGITNEEYNNIKESNLNLKDKCGIEKCSRFGDLLYDTEEKGKVYVEGLYVCKNEKLKYGYNFRSNYIKLDRDRKLVDTFDISWYSSAIWLDIVEKNKDKYSDICTDMIQLDAMDVHYIDKIQSNGLKVVAEELYKGLTDRYGENIIPVCDNAEYEEVKSQGLNPVITKSQIKNIIKNHVPIELATGINVTKKDNILLRLKVLYRKIEQKCSYDEMEEFKNIISNIEDWL